MNFQRRALSSLLLLLALPFAATNAFAAETAYQQPSPAIQAVLDASSLPSYLLAPNQGLLAIAAPRKHRSIADLSRPVLQLAGLRFDPASSSRQLLSPIDGLALRKLDAPDAPLTQVKLPAGGDFHMARWSPDSRHLLLQRRTAVATELWVVDAATGALRRLSGVRLNAVLTSHSQGGALANHIAWLSADEFVVATVPDKRGPAPASAVPAGPSVQESWGRKSPEVTYQDLLKNAQDEAVFAYHAGSVLRRVDLKTGASREIGEPGMIASVQRVGTKTGDAGLLMVERLLQPFSYQVGVEDFASVVELRDGNGRLLRELGRVKLKEGVPTEGVITGPRNFWASPEADGSIYWVEALDGGDPKAKVEHRDRLMRLDAPYTGAPREQHRTAGRLSALAFVEGGRALVSDVDRERRWLVSVLLSLDGQAAPLRLQDRSLRDRYNDPGSPLQRTLPNGRSAARVDEGRLWLTGLGASRDGDRPFLDRLDLADGRKTRLFQSGLSHFEQPLAVLAADGSRVLSRRESEAEPPNLVLRSGPALAQMQALTQVSDPAPQLRTIKRELVKFKRADGVELSFWLYLPPDYKAGEKRSALVWAYPLEFTDASTAGQVSGAANRFASFAGASPLMMLLDGHVVLMDATMPVVGDPKTVNDSFVEQITANAKAIIDKAEALGVTERSRMVVGGHSYGAFMTANLLAHSDLFRSGIARSGAYNRTLTPFGFQSERRSYWDAQEVYLKLSPFNFADKLKAPILLIHGENDNNTGTYPMQSARFFAALQGTGGKVRYVTLPQESHGYSARESVGHTLWEMSEWIKRTTASTTAAAAP